MPLELDLCKRFFHLRFFFHVVFVAEEISRNPVSPCNTFNCRFIYLDVPYARRPILLYILLNCTMCNVYSQQRFNFSFTMRMDHFVRLYAISMVERSAHIHDSPDIVVFYFHFILFFWPKMTVARLIFFYFIIINHMVQSPKWMLRMCMCMCISCDSSSDVLRRWMLQMQVKQIMEFVGFKYVPTLTINISRVYIIYIVHVLGRWTWINIFICSLHSLQQQLPYNIHRSKHPYSYMDRVSVWIKCGVWSHRGRNIREIES